MTNFTKFINNHIITILFTGIVTTYLILMMFFPVAYIWAVYEDLVGEWAQWYCFLLVSILAFRISITSAHYRFFFILLGFASVYVVMEEISWGQRLLNFSSPDFFANNNLQNEANLHNLLVGPQDTLTRSIIEVVLSLSLFSYGLLYPMLLNKGFKLALTVQRWIPAPPLQLWPFFVTAAVLELSPLYMLEQELAELLVGSALLIMCWHYYSKLNLHMPTAQNKMRSFILISTVSIIFLAFLTSYATHSIPHVQAKNLDRIDYGYHKFSERYERYQAWGLIAQLKERLWEKTPRNVELTREIAILHQRAGKQKQMQKWISRALNIDLPRFQRYPEWVSVNLSLAKTYAITDNRTAIKHHLDQALTGAIKNVRRSPDNADKLYWLGLTYTDRKEFAQAARAFERALQLNPQSDRYRDAYHNSLALTNNWDSGY